MFAKPRSRARTKEWKALARHAGTVNRISIADLFKKDTERFDRFSLQDDGLLLDFSKNMIDQHGLDLLLALADACDVTGARDRLFAGDTMNASEGRPVLHPALRRPEGDGVIIGGHDIMPGIHETQRRMADFAGAVRGGGWTGITGKRIDTIVNLGIGGSDLGPRMVCTALAAARAPDMATHFLSSVDGAAMDQLLSRLDPETTLFLIASKTFSTAETMMNAATARAWLATTLKLKNDMAAGAQFAALTAHAPAATAFGIPATQIFTFPEGVGGRFSLWSPVGLSIAIAFGFDVFRILLDGAYSMDCHFREAPLRRNMPVLLALLTIWNRNFLHAPGFAVLPYAQALSVFPSYVQQLEMESNGKHARASGGFVEIETCGIVFGGTGTDGQHAFHQLLHQGTSTIPCDFIGVATVDHNHKDHHRMLLANMLAQAQALMEGSGQTSNHKHCAGNRPSNTLILKRLDPYHLGRLAALYEHKVFAQGIIWDINSFDQEGVELGKAIASDILGNTAQSPEIHKILARIRLL